MIRRNISQRLADALADTPVVLLHGARQTGKTTLVGELADRKPGRRYLTLDDAGVLAAAKSDPAAFLAGLGGPATIDEVQRAPELFPALKAAVDKQRSPGRFLLTGSANVLLLPTLSESLAGRMEILTLWPLSQGEIAGRVESFVDDVFGAGIDAKRRKGKVDVVAAVLRGGYPEVLARAAEDRRGAWFGSYVTTILQRDVRDMANIDDLAALPRLLALSATRVGALLNFSDLSRSLSIPNSTLKRYFALLEATFMVTPVPAWSTNLGLRLTKSPKLYLADTGLAAHLMGLNEQRLRDDRNFLGPLLENFVASELVKQITWSRTQPALFHYRTPVGQEVDFLLEDRAGHVVGVEVKASATIDNGHFRGLRSLAEAVGKRFVRGVLLYLGTEVVSFGPDLVAAPVEALWD